MSEKLNDAGMQVALIASNCIILMRGFRRSRMTEPMPPFVELMGKMLELNDAVDAAMRTKSVDVAVERFFDLRQQLFDNRKYLLAAGKASLGLTAQNLEAAGPGAVLELVEALAGDYGMETPMLSAISWLDTLVSEIDDGTFGRIGEDVDPDATFEMIQQIRGLAKRGGKAFMRFNPPPKLREGS